MKAKFVKKIFKVIISIFIFNTASVLFAVGNNFSKETWIFSTKNDNFAEYDISHDPDDKSSLTRFINYQNNEIKYLEETVKNYLNSEGYTFKLRRKFNNIGIIAVDVFKTSPKKLEITLPNYIHSHKKNSHSLSYLLNTTASSEKDHYSNDKLNFKDLYPKLGKDINIFVLDTGIRYTHSEFKNHQIFLHKKDLKDLDDNGHGSHVAGTIGGNKAGFAINSNLYISKVLDRNGSGDDLTIYSGFNWIVDRCSNTKGRCIVSLSLGGSKDELENKVINSLDRLGILVVSAAGNESTDACESSPAGAAGSLTVASADIYSQKLSYFSNYGSCVNVIADGENIISSWHNKDDSYTSLSGTSMATPHVSGVAALVWGENPKLSNQELKWYLVSLSKSWILGYPFLVI